MPADRLRLLMVDDDDDDAVIVRDMLAEQLGARTEFEWIAEFDAAMRAVAEQRHDVYLIDYYLGEHRGIELVQALTRQSTRAPIILLTGRDNQAIDQEAMALGASDYLVKGQFDGPLLERAIRYALMSKRAEADQRFLAEAGRQLNQTLDIAECLRLGVRLAAPRLCDYCLIHYQEPDSPEKTLVGAHHDAALDATVQKLVSFYRPDPANPESVLARVQRTGEPESFGEVRESRLEHFAHDEEAMRVMRPLRAYSGYAVPLSQRKRIAGAIVFARTSMGASYPQTEQHLADEFAARVAMALENASLYRLARRAIDARDRMLAIVSHDLRNPANTVNLSAHVLFEMVSRATDPSAMRRQIEMIKRSADQMRRLLDDLLDASRIESGRLSIALEPVNVALVVEEVCSSIQNELVQKSITLECDVPTPLPSVMADRSRIIQVLANVLNNAIKFAPRGAAIRVAAEALEREIRISTWNSGSHVATEDAPFLFEPFWQRSTTAQGGAGLGLAISKAIVEAHGGRIRATNHNDGVVVEFTLPLAPRDAADAAGPAEVQASRNVTGHADAAC